MTRPYYTDASGRRVYVCPFCRNESPAELCRLRGGLRPCVVEGPAISEPNVARCGMQTCAEHADFEPRAARHTGR